MQPKHNTRYVVDNITRTQLFRIEAPLDCARPRDALDPAGFVFHVSRCGSTLISQMLASSPCHLTVSEAPAIDDVLQAARTMEDIPRTQQIDWLRSVVRALGQRRNGQETHYFIKLAAWHNLHFPAICAAFPGTPWILVYRDPVEIMVLQLSRPGKIGTPGVMGPAVFGLDPAAVAGLSREQWCARALEAIFGAALEMRHDARGLFVNYSDLPEVILGKISRHFGIALSAKDVAADSRDKQSKASPLVRELCDVKLTAMYREMTDYSTSRM